MKKNRIYIDIVFEGKEFYPSKLKELTGFDIEELAEYGQIAKRGRYKGKPSPYGLAILKIQDTVFDDINIVLDEIIQELLNKRPQLSQSGVDEITLDFDNFSESEIEIKINKEILKKISELNANIDILSTHVRTLLLPTQRRYIYYSNEESLNAEIEDLKYFIIQEATSNNLFSQEQAHRVEKLFQYKFEFSKIQQYKVSREYLRSEILIYIIRYVNEQDLKKIPDFYKVLIDKGDV